MSREIEYDRNNQRIHEEISDMEECKHLINDVCTNPSSEQCCDFPHPEYCAKRCPFFTEEDGLLADYGIACK